MLNNVIYLLILSINCIYIPTYFSKKFVREKPNKIIKHALESFLTKLRKNLISLLPTLIVLKCYKMSS